MRDGLGLQFSDEIAFPSQPYLAIKLRLPRLASIPQVIVAFFLNLGVLNFFHFLFLKELYLYIIKYISAQLDYFSKLTELYNYHQNPVLEYFYHPSEILLSVNS